MNKHPYLEFEGTPNWAVLEQAISELSSNEDLIEQTNRDYIVGYLCKALAEGARA